VTTSFSTEEGAFLRGQVRMEEKVELQLEEVKPSKNFDDLTPAPETGDSQNQSDKTLPTGIDKGRKVA
jgi:hypothetical protein